MITSLAYLGIGSPHKDEWPPMATEMWGAMLADPGPDGAVRLKIDEAPWRLQIHPAEQDETRYLGWGVDWEEDLDALEEALAEAGVTAERGSAELAAARAVNRILVFTDPWGFRHEVTWGQTAQRSTFRPGRAISGFVTGQQGLGHVLLLLPDIEEGHRFFTRLGFRLSDKIIVPGKLNARFYHCNARHHTLALGECPPGVAGINHLMIQVGSLDDVGTGYEIAQRMGVPITLTLGRHTNDQQLSFYHSTPSSFHVEYGFGGLEVDEETWVPKVYDRTAVWGHAQHPDAEGRPPGLMHKLPEAPANRPAQ